MPALSICALVGVMAGLWIPVFNTASAWPLTGVFLAPLIWWLGGNRGMTLLFSFALASLHGHWYLERKLPVALVKQDILVTGLVADFPRQSAAGTAFTFRLTGEHPPLAGMRKLQLRSYDDQLVPAVGEYWQLQVRLKQPFAVLNAGMVDRERYRLQQRIHATGYVRTSELNRRLAAAPAATRLLRWRGRIRDRLAASLHGNPMSGLIIGICIGVRGDIDMSTWRILRDTGTSHLMAISGLHIGLVAMALWYLGRLLGCLVNQIVPRFQPLLLARLVSLCAALGYALLAGFALPTVRAVIMVACVLVLGGLQRRGALMQALLAALLLMLLRDPLDVLSAAFWLSFLAVALLCVSVQRACDEVDMPGRLQRWFTQAAGWLARSSAAQVMLSFGLALPTLIFFGQVSLVAIAANLIAVPVFSLFLLPVVLVGAALMLAGLWPADFVLDAGAQGLARLLEFLAILADLPGATRAPVSYGALTFVLAAFATLVVLLPRPLPGRVCALALLVAALHAGRFSAKPKLTVQVIDVGQGLSVLVQTENHNLLYDTGASWRDGDAGLSFILPALRFAGVRHLDTLVISHADTDHSGGAESIIQELPVARVLAADEHSQTYFDAQGCYAGMHWWWDSVEFRVLHPDPQHNWSENNGSCVLLVSSGASVLLLPGDIERAAELSLVGRHDLSSADLLLGPHHGSKTSSTDVFVEAATARHVVFSAGYANRWGFPRPEIMARWSAGGSCILLTSISGALRFVAAETGGFRLADARRSSLLRPWPIRNSESIRCVNTINGVDGGL